MTPAEAESLARARLAVLAQADDPGGNRDWTALAEAARRALDGDRTAAAVFRRVFDGSGFAASASGFEIGYAALGLGLCGDTAALPRLEAVSMPFNGIDQMVGAACVLLRVER